MKIYIIPQEGARFNDEPTIEPFLPCGLKIVDGLGQIGGDGKSIEQEIASRQYALSMIDEEAIRKLQNDAFLMGLRMQQFADDNEDQPETNSQKPLMPIGVKDDDDPDDATGGCDCQVKPLLPNIY